VCTTLPDNCNCEGNSTGSICKVVVLYGDNSGGNGTLTADHVTVTDYTNGSVPQNLTSMTYFGLLTMETDGFAYKGDTDGILGMSFASLSDNVPTFLDQLVSQHNVENVFGICMGDENGIITIGGIENQYYVGNIFYSPIIPFATFQQYNIQFLGLTLYGEMGGNDTVYVVADPSVNNTNVIVANVSALVDSGTNLILLDTTIFNAFSSQILSWCQNNPSATLLCGANNILSGGCITDFTMEDIDMLPNITFYLGVGANNSYIAAVLQPTDYVILNFDETTGQVKCAEFGIAGSDFSLQLTGSILGDPFMHGFFTIFDRVNMKLGFAQKNEEMCGTQLSPQEESSSSSGLKAWQIALIVVGGVIVGLVLLAIVGGIIYYVVKTRSQYQYTRINNTEDQNIVENDNDK